MEGTIHRLRVLRTVVETGSFNAAAMAFGISQSSVSMHIQALERESGLPLFVRRPGSAPQLTEAGRLMYEFAVEVTSKAEQVEAELQRLRRASDRLTVSVQRTIANDILPPFITRFCRQYPGKSITVYSQTQNRVIDQIRSEKAEIGLIMTLSPVPGLDSEVIGYHDLVFVVGPRHELARRRRVRASELEKYGFIGPIETSNHSKIIDAALKRMNIRNYHVILRVEDDKTAKEVAKQGIGVAVLPICCVRSEIAEGQLVPIEPDGLPVSLEMRLIYKSKQKISETAKMFIRYLKKNLPKHEKLVNAG